jgi:hypothetical protein
MKSFKKESYVCSLSYFYNNFKVGFLGLKKVVMPRGMATTTK